MPRYIDAEKLCELARNNIDGTVDANDIMRFPTADVQEVVRCKDCKYSCEEKPVFGITDYSCIKLGIHCLDANDFCSYGAKMDEEVEDERG